MKAIILAIILALFGVGVEYRVQRIRPNKETGVASSKDGTTVLRTTSYRKAMERYKSLRTAENDTVVIRAVFTLNQRHGGVTAK